MADASPPGDIQIRRGAHGEILDLPRVCISLSPCGKFFHLSPDQHLDPSRLFSWHQGPPPAPATNVQFSPSICELGFMVQIGYCTFCMQLLEFKRQVASDEGYSGWRTVRANSSLHGGSLYPPLGGERSLDTFDTFCRLHTYLLMELTLQNSCWGLRLHIPAV